MLLNGESSRTIIVDKDHVIRILDQTLLPFKVKWLLLSNFSSACHAIKAMQVRGAPAIGIVAAYGMALAAKENSQWASLVQAAERLKSTRPTAVNLAWAVDLQLSCMESVKYSERFQAAMQHAALLSEQDIETCSAIGDVGVEIIKDIAAVKNQSTVNILTHCNAGWLATVDWGTALAPIYKAQAQGIDVHVWVDETRPRNQGALLTTFELSEQGVKNTLICDNAGGHLMQQGLVDLCLVGSDRTTANGDVCNKIGTYLKALAAKENDVPFYVALPSSTVDWTLSNGDDIPIEVRDPSEILSINSAENNNIRASAISLPGVEAFNPAFDVTPGRYISGLITEKGVFEASTQGLANLKAYL